MASMHLVSSSLLEKDQGHPGHVQAYGFSPVWVRRCAFRCELFVYTCQQFLFGIKSIISIGLPPSSSLDTRTDAPSDASLQPRTEPKRQAEASQAQRRDRRNHCAPDRPAPRAASPSPPPPRPTLKASASMTGPQAPTGLCRGNSLE